MSNLRYLSAITSTAFRGAAFLFLRIIPSRWGKTVIPALFICYIASLLFDATDQVPNGKLLGKNGRSKTSNGRESSILTLLLSRPSSSPSLARINILLNLLLILAVAEFVAYPFVDPASKVIFTRVGAVYPEAVKLVVRYPYLNTSDVQVIWRETLISGVPQNWSAGPSLHLEGESDWVDTVTLGGLWPSTSYEYRLSTTNKTFLPYPAMPVKFRTFPDPRLPTGNHFRFLVSSCVTPNFPYVPFNGKTIKGFDLMARYIFPAHGYESRLLNDHDSGVRLPESGGPTIAHSASPPTQSIGALSPPQAEFLMFLGDFIYADVPLYVGDNKDTYRRLYRRNYQSKSFRKIYEHLPVFHTYDDHEFIDNFVGRGNDSVLPFPNAYDAFRTYNGNANYGSSNTYYDFRYGDIAFFVMDTRRYRSDLVTSELSNPLMLGEEQLSAFFTWLGDVNSTTTFKFIVTSVPFTTLWGFDAASASWAGYPEERESILNALHSVPNVIILSGGRHEFAVVEFNGAEYQHTIREVSTSPLSMFYIPFIRTLQMRSVETVRRKRAVVDITDDIAEPIATIEVPRERVLKYIPSGNYKWSAFEVNTTDLKRPTVRLEVSIDGAVVYNLEVIGTPAKLGPSRALGMFVPGSLKNMLDKMGIKPIKWF